MAKIKLVEFESLDSTNDYLKTHYETLPHFTFVRADFQTKGRGQFDRVWESTSHHNLLLSLLLKEMKFEQLERISSWIVQSVLSLLKDYGIAAHFKIPNDIYVGDKKICGILIETQSKGTHVDFVVAGIGLNINQHEFNDSRATSIKKETKRTYAIRRLMRHLMGYLVNSYESVVSSI